MLVFGIDFTSCPSRSKPLTCQRCALDGDTLRAEAMQKWPTFAAFEEALRRPGPWIAGIDFPFGQARRFIENIGWPQCWADYVSHAEALGLDSYRQALLEYKKLRPYGDKEHKRATDKVMGGAPPQKLYGVPVGLMFFAGAPRLLKAKVHIPHLQDGDLNRIVVEAYPGVLVRSLVGKVKYKAEAKREQAPAQRAVREDIFRKLVSDQATQERGFRIDADDKVCVDPTGDELDALLCAVQAARAWTMREERYGAPEYVDPLEGWVSHPHP